MRARGDVSAVLETLWRGWQDVHGLRMLMECTEIALDLAELWQRPAGDERLRGLIEADAAAKAPEVVEATRTVAARNPGVAHLQATALAVAGVADGDAEALLEAERVMSATPRRLDHARIAELAALALPAYSERTRVLAETALHEYQEVGADHEATRARAQFRLLGVKVPGQRRRPASGWGSLTRTEERIAGHVATGETNLEIAQSLFVSRRTVETHVSNILAKLGLRSRTELAIRFAARLDKPGQ
ncbi:response regulator transcription factor [Microbacterium sp.]|uniref:helix-turn-helix transcriptional regulator n=1 Tax=Microbacterium sp. TaxID=51671 RepID=UPI003C70F7BA